MPQWQGALWDGAAARLPDGCRALAALAADVLGADVRELPVRPGGSPTVAGIGNRAALTTNRDAQLSALESPDGAVLTIGGDCAVDLVPPGVARFRHGRELTVVWFDAHADCNTAESSPSGAFHGMVLRSLFGDGDAEFAAGPPLERGHAVLVGTRAFDAAERQAVVDGLVRHVPPPADPADVRDTLAATGSGPVYLHVDLDVLDPATFGGTYYHEPGGLTVEQLCAALDGVSGHEVVGAAVTECATVDASELAAVTPVLEVIGRLLTDSSRC